MNIRNVTLCATLLASVSTVPAFAHTSFVNPTAEQESTIVAALQVPHGCDGGLATTEVRIQLPEGFISAKPQPKAGWDIEIIKDDYKKSYMNHGTELKSGPIEIRWTGGDLPDAYYDTFNVQGKISGLDAGTDLPFKVTQVCGDKGTANWDEIAAKGQDPHSLNSPAPTIKIVAKQATGEGQEHDHTAHNHGAGEHAEDVVKSGDLELSGAVAKAMLPGQPVGGGFVTIKNDGSSDDRLISVETPLAGRSEIHEMAMVNDVMKMRKLNEGIVIPAGKTVELTPGGLHFMFFNVKKPFAEGDKVPATLTFEKAGKVDVVIEVGSAKGGDQTHNHN
ncbi:copper chaperone PCu(A)C [Agrobacterium rosae]|uniref:copper chaperone PCu(A)C n=1 Tax=Agrobacterium rosae TaxID=1972867 RepID=UPI003A807915